MKLIVCNVNHFFRWNDSQIHGFLFNYSENAFENNFFWLFLNFFFGIFIAIILIWHQWLTNRGQVWKIQNSSGAKNIYKTRIQETPMTRGTSLLQNFVPSTPLFSLNCIEIYEYWYIWRIDYFSKILISTFIIFTCISLFNTFQHSMIFFL